MRFSYNFRYSLLLVLILGTSCSDKLAGKLDRFGKDKKDIELSALNEKVKALEERLNRINDKVEKEIIVRIKEPTSSASSQKYVKSQRNDNSTKSHKNKPNKELNEDISYKDGDLVRYLSSYNNKFKRDLPKKFRNYQLSKRDIDFIVANNPYFLMSISKVNKLSDEQIETAIKNWKSDRYSVSFNSTLFEMLNRFDASSKENLLKILNKEPGTYRKIRKNYESDIKFISKVDKNFKKIISKSIEYDGKIFSGSYSVVQLWAKHNPKDAIALGKDYLAKDSSLDRSNNTNMSKRRGIFSMVKPLNLTSKEYRDLYNANEKRICKILNSDIISKFELTDKEIVKCIGETKNLRLYEHFARVVNEDTFIKMLEIMAEANLSSFYTFPDTYLNHSKAMKIFSTKKEAFIKHVLKEHNKIKNSIFKSSSLSFRDMDCEKILPNLLRKNEKVVASSLDLLPYCSILIDSSLFESDKFRKTYLFAWVELRKIIEQNFDMEESRGRGENSRENSVYVNYLKENNSYFTRNGAIARRRRYIARKTPLERFPNLTMKDEKFVKEVLKTFPEDYFNIPISMRMKFSGYSEKAIKTGFEALK